MLSETSPEFRTFFLLKFTEELIRHSGDIEIIRLKEILSKKHLMNPAPKKIDIREEVLSKLGEKPEATKKDLRVDPFSFSSKRKTGMRRRNPVMRPQVPRREIQNKDGFIESPSIAEIKPVANREVLIDVGKLNPFISDPNVNIIETEGEEKPVFVGGSMGKKPTAISLTREEIEEVIDKFSEEGKVPKSDGMFKVAIGNLVLTAMVSETLGSRFIIKKLQ